MADGVTKAFMLDKIPVDGKSIFILQEESSSPFFHTFLSQNAKLGRNICLVSFNQNQSYYHNIGTRLGWNSKTLQSKNQFAFIGGLPLFPFNSESDKSAFDFLFDDTEFPLKTLALIIKDTIEKWSPSPVTLFVDELNSLLNLGVSMKHVVAFYQFCRAMVGITDTANISLIVSSGSSVNDLEAMQSASLFSLQSHLVLTEKGLQTGLSKDLSGTVTMDWKIAPYHHQQYQYKSFERGIRIFAPGTCTAVL